LSKTLNFFYTDIEAIHSLFLTYTHSGKR